MASISMSSLNFSLSQDPLIHELTTVEDFLSTHLPKSIKHRITEIFKECISKLEQDRKMTKDEMLFHLRQESSILLTKLSKENLKRLEKQFNRKHTSKLLNTIFLLTNINQKIDIIICNSTNQQEKDKTMKEILESLDRKFHSKNRIEPLILISKRLANLKAFDNIQKFIEALPDPEERDSSFYVTSKILAEESNNIDKILELIHSISDLQMKKDALDYAYNFYFHESYFYGVHKLKEAAIKLKAEIETLGSKEKNASKCIIL